MTYSEGLTPFLLDLWRLEMVTGGSRPDAGVSLSGRNDHLLECDGVYLVPGEAVEGAGIITLTATLECGHGEAVDVEYALNDQLWILRKYWNYD